MKLLLDIKPYNDMWYKNCYYNPLFSALQYYHKDITDFLTNDIFSFTFKEESRGLKLVFHNISKKTDIDVLSEQGIHLEELTDNSNLEKTVKHYISKNIPLILPFDRYHWSSQTNSEHFETRHDIHYFLVTGYDDERKEYHVIHSDEQNAINETINYSEFEKTYFSYKENLLAKYNQQFYAITCTKINDYLQKTMESYCQQYKRNLNLLRDELYSGLLDILKAIDYFQYCFNEKDLISDDEQYFCLLSFFLMEKGLDTEMFEITLFLGDGPFVHYLNEIKVRINALRKTFVKLLIRKKYTENDTKKIVENLTEIHNLRKGFYDCLFSTIVNK